MPMASFQRLRCQRVAHRAPAATPDQIGSGIGKILVLAAPEPVPSHRHPAAETAVVRIGFRQRATFFRREQSLENRAALRIEIAAACAVDRIDAPAMAGWRDGWMIFLTFDFMATSFANHVAQRHPITGKDTVSRG